MPRDPAVVFHICQVGDNEGAEAFLSSLQADTEVGETGYVYVTREKVKEASSLRSEEKELAEDVAYNLWVGQTLNSRMKRMHANHTCVVNDSG